MNWLQTDKSQYAGCHGRTIFVVDDNKPVRKLVRTMLESEGLLVVDADGPASALELLDKFETAPDLMICDISMPVMSGPELYQVVEKRFPAQPVLFITAYLNEHLERGGTIVTEERLLRKPFRVSELVDRVGRMLG
jgi:CheY-like chemotaxis protein